MNILYTVDEIEQKYKDKYNYFTYVQRLENYE